ncbi:AfsR/SARP family transcriptional regulator [Rugosimonospora africana]|uniref:SARP family transcriptional regulator n=1 Tax=Rugosimonospora africana TaxID=556532 RepID=A0A8J3VV57_9ACTN|nr:tetratricopeptide repeat protein [Rugosimonospora africana]GIH19451.1 SARP family transcriptional regulator [Rugosimonospora africana]
MEFRLLGSVELRRGEEPVALSGQRCPALLAALLLRANQTVSLSWLAEAVWERPPASLPSNVRTHVAELRARLREAGDDGSRLASVPGGYRLAVAPDELDVYRFEQLADQAGLAERQGELVGARDLLREAVGLWRGQPLEGLAMGPALVAEVARLRERRLAVAQRYALVRSRLGDQESLVADLRRLTAESPLREGLWVHLIQALHREGSTGEALEAYRQARRVLVDELGIEPGPQLRRLHQEVLATTAPGPPEPPGAPPTSAGDDRRATPPQPAAPESSTARPDSAAPDASAPHGDAVALADADRSAATGAAHQLPPDIAEFTGRETELRDLRAAVPSSGHTGTAPVICAIDGMAGIGKTRVAIHLAHQFLHSGRYGDVQLYVDLRGHAEEPPADAATVLASFLGALGVPDGQIPPDLPARAALYRDRLHGRHSLVLLDNAASEDQVLPLLPASPTGLVLVTSRRVLSLEGARNLSLDVFSDKEAEALFTQILGGDRTGADPAATRTVADLCGRLPLALALAARRLRARPAWTFADLATRLARDGDRLAQIGTATRRVRAVFDLSYQALPDDARRQFRFVGLHPGDDVSVDSTAALTDLPVAVTRELLDFLVDERLLIQAGADRYRLHDLIRIYAAGLAAAEEPETQRRAAVDRLCDWYLRHVSAAADLAYPQVLRLPADDDAPALAAFDDRAQALAWLDTERANLVAAVHRGIGHRPSTSACQLADALRGYLSLRRDPAWVPLAEATLAAAIEDGEPYAKLAAYVNLAQARSYSGEALSAIDRYAEALAISQEIGWRVAESAIHRNLAAVYWQLGRLTDAVDQLQSSSAIDEETGWTVGRAAALGNLATIHFGLGRLTEAARYHQRALDAFRVIGSAADTAMALANLGETYAVLGRHDGAIDLLDEALTLCREVGNRKEEANVLTVLARLHLDRADLSRALDLARAGSARAVDSGDPYNEVAALSTVGAVLHELGRYGEAAEHHDRAYELARRTEDRYGIMRALIGLAAAEDRLGRSEAALRHAREARTMAAETGFRLAEAEALACLAGILMDRDEPAEAAEFGRAALRIAEETGHQRIRDRMADLLRPVSAIG